MTMNIQEASRTPNILDQKRMIWRLILAKTPNDQKNNRILKAGKKAEKKER